MENFLQQLIYGLALGSTYALIALTITLVFRGMDLINFAQGEIFMVGAFLGYMFHVDFGLPMIIAFPLSMVAAFIFGSLLEWIFFRKLENNPGPLPAFLMTVALFIILRNAAQLIFGSTPFLFPPLMEKTFVIGTVQINVQYIVVIVVTMIMMGGLYLLFTKTNLGLSLRAVAQDKTTARMMGINVSQMNNITFGLCALLGAAAGIVYAPLAIVSFDMGNLIMLKGFTAALLGGLGLVSGAVFGGLILGIIEQFGTLMISSAYKDLISFSILLLIILIKPNGIFGKKRIKKV